MRNWIYMEDEEDTPIRTFGEGDNQDTTPADVEEAEEDIEEKEAEHELRMHWLATYGKTGLEYATPSGSDPVGGNCQGGCADAGDAVVVEAEIVDAPDADTDDDDLGEDFPADDTEGDAESEEIELKHALEMLHMETHQLPLYQAQNESFSSKMFSYIGGAIGAVVRGIGKLLNRSAKLTATLVTTILSRVTRAHKIWKLKLSGIVDQIDDTKLNTISVNVIPEKDWWALAKLTLKTHDALKKCETHIFDPSKEVLPPSLSKIIAEYAELGIELKNGSLDANYDGYLDRIVIQTLPRHGYQKSQLDNYNRYLGRVGEAIDTNSKAGLDTRLGNAAKKVFSKASTINESVTSGALKKGSEQYKQSIDSIVLYNTRLQYMFGLNCVVFTSFNLLVKDIIVVFEGFVKAKK